MNAQGVCTDCDQRVIRLFSVGGKLIDLNPNPVDDGNQKIVTLGNGEIRARTLTGIDLPHPKPVYRLHVCPVRERPGLACANPRCEYPLPRLKGRWPYHAACEPEFLEQLAAEQRKAARRRPRRR